MPKSDFSKIINQTDKPIPIADYLLLVNECLEGLKARIIGEVSELKIWKSGHVYFTLKDDQAVIDCVIWKHNYNLLGVELKEGLQIIATGSPDVYLKTGRFSFKASTVELVGEGALKKAYEELKKKLTEEHLFDKERKRPLPDYVSRVGVITSKSGAVIHDFLNNLGKFGFKVQMIDSQVEGQKAVKDLFSSIRSFRKQNIDVLVIMRGGGSLESLMAFNNEALVREVARFPVPVIAGIGHHKDVPLVGLAADVMVSTPTAVANLLNESWEKAGYEIESYERDIFAQYAKILNEKKSLLKDFFYSVQNSFNMILEQQREVERILRQGLIRLQHGLISCRKEMTDYLDSISRGFTRSLNSLEQEFENIKRIIDFNNPQRQLRLGYSIARIAGKVIKSIKDVRIGEEVKIQVSDGSIDSQVKKTHEQRETKSK